MAVKALRLLPKSALQEASRALEKKAEPKGHQQKGPAMNLGSMKDSTPQQGLRVPTRDCVTTVPHAPLCIIYATKKKILFTSVIGLGAESKQ